MRKKMGRERTPETFVDSDLGFFAKARSYVDSL